MIRSALIRIRPTAIACLTLMATSCGGQRSPAAGLPPVAGVDPAALQAPPVYSLLGFREQLQLTSEQIARLDSIADQLASERRDAPLIASDGERVTFGRGTPAPTPEQLATIGALAGTNRRAVEAVEETLTAAQRERVCELVRSDPTRPEPSAPAGQNRRMVVRSQGGGGAAGAGGGGLYVWPWCRSAGEAEDPPGAATR